MGMEHSHSLGYAVINDKDKESLKEILRQASWKWCKEKKITKADVLGFDYEMGLDFEIAKKFGIDIQFKVIPREVFDRKAVEKGQVKFL